VQEKLRQVVSQAEVQNSTYRHHVVITVSIKSIIG